MAQAKLPTIDRSLVLPVWYTAQRNPAAGQPPEISEHQDEFIARPLPKIPDFKPKVSSIVSNMPFRSVSEHHDQFNDFSNSFNKNLRTRKDLITLSKDPIGSNTLYRNDFQKHHYEKAAPVKPIPPTVQNSLHPEKDTAFGPDTTSIYRQDFLKPKEKAKKISFSESAPVIVTVSSDEQKMSTPSSFDPDQSLKTGPTDYKGNFSVPGYNTRTRLPVPVYKKPKEPFECCSTYNNEFVKKPYSKLAQIAASERDNNLLHMEGTDFHGRSLYKTDFVPRKLDPADVAGPNVRQNHAAISYTCPQGDWWNNTASQPFKDYREQMFYQA